MRTWQLVLAVCVLGGWTLSADAAQKKDKASLEEMLVGNWVPEGGGKGLTLDFTKDGSVSVTQTLPNGQSKTTNGTYTLKKKRLTVTYNVQGREVKQVFRISKLNTKKLVLVDEQSGTPRSYKHGAQ